MSFPDTRGPRIPKRHPACPGKRRCRLPGCIHNSPPITTLSAADEIPVELFDPADGDNNDATATHGSADCCYPADEMCGRDGATYQRLDYAGNSELGSDGGEIMNKTICAKMKVLIDRMRSCFC